MNPIEHYREHGKRVVQILFSFFVLRFSFPHPNFGLEASWREQRIMHRLLRRFASSNPVLRLSGVYCRCASNVPFLLADIGEGIQEVEVLKWHVAVGDTLQQFDKVCEVQSDKAVVEITSRYEGVVTSLAESSIVQVGKPLLHLTTTSDDDDNAESSSDEVSDTSPETQGSELTSSTLNGVRISKDEEVELSDKNNKPVPHVANGFQMSPAVRKLVHESNIDPSRLHGTGPNGRVLKADVLSLLNGAKKGAKPDDEPNLTSSNPESDTIVPLRGYSRIMFDR